MGYGNINQGSYQISEESLEELGELSQDLVSSELLEVMEKIGTELTQAEIDDLGEKFEIITGVSWDDFLAACIIDDVNKKNPEWFNNQNRKELIGFANYIKNEVQFGAERFLKTAGGRVRIYN